MASHAITVVDAGVVLHRDGGWPCEPCPVENVGWVCARAIPLGKELLTLRSASILQGTWALYKMLDDRELRGALEDFLSSVVTRNVTAIQICETEPIHITHIFFGSARMQAPLSAIAIEDRYEAALTACDELMHGANAIYGYAGQLSRMRTFILRRIAKHRTRLQSLPHRQGRRFFAYAAMLGRGRIPRLPVDIVRMIWYATRLG